MCVRRFVLVLGGWLMWATLSLAGPPSIAAGEAFITTQPLDVDEAISRTWLDGALSIYRDESGHLDFEGIRDAERRGEFMPVKGPAVLTATSAGTPVWIHFQLRFSLNDPTSWWLLLTPDLLSSITVYAEQTNGDFAVHLGGSALPFEHRELPAIGHAFELGQSSGGLRHYFIRLTGFMAMRAEPSIWKERPLIDYLSQFRGISFYYLGLISVLIVLAVVRALRYRKPLDLAYLGYLVSYEMFTLSYNGLPTVTGLIQNELTRVWVIQLGLLLIGFCFLAVTRTLIVWPPPTPRWSRLLWLGTALTGLLLSVTALAAPDLLMEFNFKQAIFWILVSGMMGFWASWQGYTHARLFMGCFLPFIFWAIMLSLGRSLNIPLPHTFTSSQILMATSSLHLLLLWQLVLSSEARLKEAKRELEQRLSELNSETSHIRQFLLTLGHELNRPLQALANLAEPVLAGFEQRRAGPTHAELMAIHQCFSHVISTCMDQIRLAAVQRLEPKPTDLGALIRWLTDQFQLKSSNHQIRCHLDELPVDFQCDPKLIGSLLINLLENAVNYSPDGGFVWVSGKSVDANTIEICVTDEGPGIPVADRERIFERYVQVETPAPGSMGMGLFIMKRIAEMHGGGVVCESILGEGTTFRVKLMRCQAGKISL